MPHRWYYQILMEECGPVTEEQLQQLMKDGTLSSDDLVRPENSAKWTTAGSVGHQSAPDDSGPADLSDLSELSFRFEQTGPTRRKTACSNSAPLPVTSTTPPAPWKEPAFIAQEPNTAAYYCKSLGQVFGPMSMTGLTNMAESGTLSDSDLVRTGKNGAWLPASSLSELSATFMLSDRGTTEAAAMSTTTQKRPDPAAVSSLQAASATENVSVVEPQEPAVIETPQRVISPAAELPGKKKVRKRKGKKGEEEILDEIFDDVFASNEEETPVRRPAPGPPETAASSTPASAGPARTAVPPASSRPSRHLSIDFDGPVKFVAIGVLVASVIGGVIWQFGLPSVLFVGDVDASKYVPGMTLAVGNFKALGEEPQEGPWEDFCLKTRSEFLLYRKDIVERGGSGVKFTASIDGIKAVIALTQTKPDQKDRHQELVAEIEKCLTEISK